MTGISVSCGESSIGVVADKIYSDSQEKKYFGIMGLNQVSEEASAYAKSHPHRGKGIRI
jgi:hypothetical protein